MRFVVLFTNNGVPTTGLSATIDIYDLGDNSHDVTGGAMTEIGQGLYQYNYADADESKEYVARMDGSATLPNAERYQVAASFEGPFSKRMREVWQRHGLDPANALVNDASVPNGSVKVPADGSKITLGLLTESGKTTVTRTT